MTAPIAPDLFRAAMRRTASGVAIVTTDGGAGRTGITVSSLCSLSTEPPSVLCCLHRDSQALPPLLQNGVFTANVLAVDQAAVADAFAGLVPAFREDRFAAAEWTRLATGAPALVGALCSFDCRLASVFEFGSHAILAGAVLALQECPCEPLVYSDRSYRRLSAA